MRVKLPSLTPGLEETRCEATEGRDKNDNDNEDEDKDNNEDEDKDKDKDNNEDEDENSRPLCPPETGATSAKRGGGG